jgi:hypothetical protein
MPFVFNPFTGNLDAVRSGDISGGNVKLKWALESIKAFDKVVSISYIFEGTKDQAISEIVFSSVDFPDIEMIKTVNYLDIGLEHRRINTVDYNGPILNGLTIRKNYNYDSSFKRLGFSYEVI